MGFLFWYILILTAIATITIAVSVLITREEIKRNIRIQCPESLKAKLIEKKKNAVRLIVFDKSEEVIAGIEITSDQGVSAELTNNEFILQ